jgi:small GTP-binding protein
MKKEKDENNNDKSKKKIKNSLNKNDKSNKYNAEIVDYKGDFVDYALNFKIIVIGSSGVGKTCITNQATKHIFNEEMMSTSGMEIYDLFIKIDNKILKLQIWDTCGQEIYRSLISSFYRSSSLAVIVYAIDRRQSFDEIDLWIKELKNNNSPDSKIILVGNKLDLAEYREIQYEEGEQKAKDNAFIDFFETSAKTGENISKMFIKVANILYEEHLNFKGIETDDQFQTFKPNKPNFKVVKKKGKKNKKKCC